MKVATLLFAALLGFWLLLSGRFDPLFVGMGVVAAAVVTAMTYRELTDVLGPRSHGVGALARRAWYFAIFAVWLLSRIPPAAWQTVWIVIHPSLPARPHIVTFTTQLASPVARTMLANSISLVPGTITVAVIGNRFVVHALVPDAAEDLRTSVLQNRIADIFLEPHEPPPTMTWDPPLPSRPSPDGRAPDGQEQP